MHCESHSHILSHLSGKVFQRIKTLTLNNDTQALYEVMFARLDTRSITASSQNPRKDTNYHAVTVMIQGETEHSICPCHENKFLHSSHH